MLKLIMTVGVGLIRAKNTGWGVRRGLCIPLWMKGWGIEES